MNLLVIQNISDTNSVTFKQFNKTDINIFDQICLDEYPPIKCEWKIKNVSD